MTPENTPDKLVLQTDVNYSAWATRRLLAACAGLTDEELNRNLGLSHRSVLQTLSHIFISEEFWISCIVSQQMPNGDDIGTEEDPLYTLAELNQRWPTVWSNFDAWLATLSDSAFETTISACFPQGIVPLSRFELLRHSVNHATLHRGQVVSMLRMLGKQPPNVDLMGYLLSRC